MAHIAHMPHDTHATYAKIVRWKLVRLPKPIAIGEIWLGGSSWPIKRLQPDSFVVFLDSFLTVYSGHRPSVRG